VKSWEEPSPGAWAESAQRASHGGRGLVTIPARPTPSLADLRKSFAALVRVGKRTARPDDLDSRDQDFITDMQPMLDVLYDSYFRCETELEAELPSGPFFAVANHNGMTGTPDMFCHMAAFWRHATPARLAYGLMHDMPFNVPAAGAWLNASGAIRASVDSARAALGRGAAVLVFPGGDVDACKPFSARYEIRFGNRRGFIREALREQVPIVPIVSVGAHESLYLFTDGRNIAQRLGLKERFRSNVAPLGFALPWGLVAGIPYPHLPPPVKVHTRIWKPIYFDAPNSAARDANVVEACFERVVMKMRVAIDALKREGRHGLFPKRTSVDGGSVSSMFESQSRASMKRGAA
jgi:1-acyl-sn-glycerol-3-phosphate acyltransferase